MPRAGADKFGSARAAVKPRCFRGMRREHRKNQTRIGPHLAQPWAAERPVISVLEFGYVRRSEFSMARLRLLDGGPSIDPRLSTALTQRDEIRREKAFRIHLQPRLTTA